ncbi:MAG TPA: hypothetical protein VHZ76_00235, partial [Gammaproteobacteria bacterium]|nr:hypothetical protein [Gammaproteobacteria bacterium]
MTALISDPQNPAVWSDSKASQFEIDFAWLEFPDHDLSHAKSRFEKVMEHHFNTTRGNGLEKIITTAFEKYAIKDEV